MMKIADTHDIAYRQIPACIHTDGTSRYHTVNKTLNDRFYKVIQAFYQKTGIPVVMNTSFNLAGMAIVETPADAINCFLMSEDVNYLYLNNYCVTKK